MKSRKALIIPLICLGFVHSMAFLAGFFSPYDFAAQNRSAPYAPPSRIHWRTSDGRLAQRPFVYPLMLKEGDFQNYLEDTRTPFPIRFLPQENAHSIGSSSIGNRRLFGVEAPAHIWLMGTDGYGRDIFSRVLYGGRISLLAGLLATVLALALGVSMGIIAGFYGGWLDAIIMRSVDIFVALPWLYLLLALRAFLPLHVEPADAFLMLVAVIGAVGWARPARLIRGVVLSAKERSHILAARSFGSSGLYLLRRHILPETRDVVLTQASLLIPQYILAEVTLSFLGLGVGEPVPSWGSLLSDLQQYHVLASKWWMFFPGLVLIPVILSYGWIANALLRNTGWRREGAI